MATRKSEAMAVVARARRLESLGWDVERLDDGRFLILAPPGGKGTRRGRVEVHLSPSDVHHIAVVLRKLNVHGFERDEQKYLAEQEDAKKDEVQKTEQANRRNLINAQNRAATVERAAGPYGSAEVTIAELLGKHPSPRIYHRVLVTPEMATAILERNVLNRPIRPTDVAMFSMVLRTGRWRFTHQGVAIDDLMRLQDGQQRLTAIKETGVAAEMNVSVWMDAGNFPVIDTGRRRTAAQAVTMSSEKKGTGAARAAACRLFFLWDTWGISMLSHLNERPTNDIIVEVSQKLDESLIEWAIHSAYRLRAEHIVRGVAAPAAAFYMIADNMPPNSAEVVEFVEGLVMGRQPILTDPVYLLRRAMTRRAGDRIVPAYQTAHIIRGWNFFIEGRRPTAVPAPTLGSVFPTVSTGPAQPPLN